ncbi:DedA family protein [Aeromonas veronii]|uniref:DedA family protein n=1 Tax=Aeromonas veronii TaxID=654 RepID=UPI0018812FCA|nr:DedA family protein [Aeromonas veronii]MBE8736713.1 DedA family protein [Aeromonas veronii]MBE8741499.1 DedA family protein [Aeromonas veronii]MBE8742612.1 DedA family protein [Aeromonas veronii]MBE8765495.1 DedA family protein [Aeromonas veronii]MBE8838161.1 DedA family protein [Aeromonas veronii]
MLDMLMAIWHQDFDALVQMQAVPLLISCLMLVLLLESAFVFLPLPGDSLVLLAGGLVGMGVFGPEVTLIYLPLAAGIGSVLAYWQGRALQRTRFMDHIERMLPPDSLPKATRLLKQYGFLAMFSSRFIPFVRVLTPMLMGIGRLSVLRMCVASFASAFMWALCLSLVGKLAMNTPFFLHHSELLTRALLITSLVLFLVAVMAILFRWFKGGAKNETSHD